MNEHDKKIRIEEHYDKEAAQYIKKFSRGLFARIRHKESGALIALLDPRKGEKILDAGCGAGFYALKLKSLGSIPFGIDIAAGMIEKIKEFGIDGKVCDIEDFALNEKYNKILCAGVFEFCKNPQLALQCLRNHLGKEGIIVVLYPRVGIGGLLLKMYHLLINRIPLRLFVLGDFEKMADNAGLRMDTIGRKNFISQAIRLKK